MEAEELIQEAKKGDKEAFTELIISIRHDLYKIAKVRLSCDADIEDAVQETIIEAFKSIKKLRKIASYKSWIIKILINKCNKIYRIRKNNQISYENLNLEELSMDVTNPTTNTDLEFYYLLKGLNYDERMTIVLFYMEDYPLKEIAKLMKTNINTVKTRLYRAKRKIKNKYQGGNING